MSESGDTERNRVFNRVRSALAPLRAGKPGRENPPKWDDELVVCRAHPDFSEPWDLFAHKFGELHGIPLRGWKAVKDYLEKLGCKQGYCDPVFLPRLEGAPFEVSGEFNPKEVDRYEFGITRASAVIAETGSIVLKDSDTSSRLGALAPWIHIAIVHQQDVLPSVVSAIGRFQKDPYVVFVTGPSKTADVEGILIEGVHGPGVQVAALVGRSEG